MTIYQLKALNEQNGGLFFSRRAMHFFGDTMRNFGMRKGKQPDTVVVYRKRAMKPHIPLSQWTFSTKTGRVIQHV